MDKWNWSLFYIFFINILVCVSGTYKKWLPNSNFGNPSNWNKGRVPCGNDKVVLHEEGPTVYLQVNTTIQELILPPDGEVVFGPGSSLAFTGVPDHSASCLSSGSEIEFNVTYPPDWMDYRNWCSTDSETGTCKTEPVLDTEAIPCQNDDVVFPKEASFYVNIESNLKLTVQTLKVSGQAYTTATFGTFLNTTEGKRTFPVPRGSDSRSVISISRRRCTDPTGCICGNSDTDILQRICKFRVPFCPKVKCSSPIKPGSSCCEICGAVLKVNYGTGFKFDDLRNGLQRTYLDGKQEYQDVTYIVSKLQDGIIQIVLSDESGMSSIQVANAMKKDLDNDNGGGFKYAVRSVTMMTSSGAGPSTGRRTAETPGMPTGEVAGLVIGLIALVCIVLGLTFYVYRRKVRGADDLGFNLFNKVSFKKPSLKRPRLEVPPSIAFRFGGGATQAVPETIGGASQGFDNPMYGTNPLENEKPMDIEMVPTDMKISLEEEQPTFDSSEGGLGFDNPLYDSTMQESLFSDPASAGAVGVSTEEKLDGKSKKDVDI